MFRCVCGRFARPVVFVGDDSWDLMGNECGWIGACCASPADLRAVDGSTE